MKSYDCQQPWHSVCTLPLNSLPQFKRTACSLPWLNTNWEGKSQPKRTCAMTPLLNLSLHTTSYNTSRNQLTSSEAYDSVPAAVDARCWEMRQFWWEDMHIWFIWIRTVHVTKQNCLMLNNPLLIPFASLSKVSRTFFSKCFSSFPHGTYLLLVLFQNLALEGAYPPFWAAFPSNPTHRKCYVAHGQCASYGIVTLYDVPFRAT